MASQFVPTSSSHGRRRNLHTDSLGRGSGERVFGKACGTEPACCRDKIDLKGVFLCVFSSVCHLHLGFSTLASSEHPTDLVALTLGLSVRPASSPRAEPPRRSMATSEKPPQDLQPWRQGP